MALNPNVAPGSNEVLSRVTAATALLASLALGACAAAEQEPTEPTTQTTATAEAPATPATGNTEVGENTDVDDFSSKEMVEIVVDLEDSNVTITEGMKSQEMSDDERPAAVAEFFEVNGLNSIDHGGRLDRNTLGLNSAEILEKDAKDYGKLLNVVFELAERAVHGDKDARTAYNNLIPAVTVPGSQAESKLTDYLGELTGTKQIDGVAPTFEITGLTDYTGAKKTPSGEEYELRRFAANKEGSDHSNLTVSVAVNRSNREGSGLLAFVGFGTPEKVDADASFAGYPANDFVHVDLIRVTDN